MAEGVVLRRRRGREVVETPPGPPMVRGRAPAQAPTAEALGRANAGEWLCT